ncbi:hypothetical protein [Burkholderia thailandensis]|nr:hypothetical protein [Burkholderia thailandensis]MCS3395797.1 hypothetical protein [Burkholderia thailandensis]MCS6471038.1 hypothetical protein [Burkholderia thailandensis]MCS6475434.1 hypothetical protein [Burkholderia thailandensis]MCS6493627.1 hypothetical protein [Burkholderia thailandensis]MCS6500972.1 hypothetical protein [Burkholderia thailandensis]
MRVFDEPALPLAPPPLQYAARLPPCTPMPRPENGAARIRGACDNAAV